MCTSAQAATLVLDRVQDASGDFTTLTYPTKARVDALIVEIINEVQSRVGLLVDDQLAALATLTVATGVAAQIELSFSDQEEGQDAKSKYAAFKTSYDERLAMLADAVVRLVEGGGLVPEGGKAWASFHVPDINDGTYPGRGAPGGDVTRIGQAF